MLHGRRWQVETNKYLLTVKTYTDKQKICTISEKQKSRMGGTYWKEIGSFTFTPDEWVEMIENVNNMDAELEEVFGNE